MFDIIYILADIGEDINKEIINEKIKWNWYSKTTTTVYDPMMQVLSELLPYKEILINNRDKIRDEIKDFYKNNYHLFGGRNTNKSDKGI